MKFNYLFVVAHPDDEVLGAGATIVDLIKKGHNVYVCILSDNSETRYDDSMLESIRKSHYILGIKEENVKIGTFSCMALDKANHYELVRFIEGAIREYKPDYIFTHHPSDINIDHPVTSEVCLEACRLPQRGLDYHKEIKAVYYMEIQSSTDWSFNNVSRRFDPNTFQGVNNDGINKKIQALEVYEGVIRPMPHPRSEEGIKALAVVRGTQCGEMLAEAFDCCYGKGV